MVAAAAVRRYLTGDVDAVFDRDRHPEQRQPLAGVQPVLRRGGLVTRAVGQHHAVTAQLAIQARNPLQVDLEQLGCRHLSVRQQLRLRGRAGKGEIASVHRGSVSR